MFWYIGYFCIGCFVLAPVNVIRSCKFIRAQITLTDIFLTGLFRFQSVYIVRFDRFLLSLFYTSQNLYFGEFVNNIDTASIDQMTSSIFLDFF